MRTIIVLVFLAAGLAGCVVPPSPPAPRQVRVIQRGPEVALAGFSYRGPARAGADRCLPPRRLVVTNDCRDAGGGRLECINACR